MNSNTKLYIPSNVKTRLEFFKGYGVKEIIFSSLLALFLLPISYIVYKINNDYLIPVLIEVIGIALSVVIITKDENNLCVLNQIKYMIDFLKLQKVYKYQYYDKWRN